MSIKFYHVIYFFFVLGNAAYGWLFNIFNAFSLVTILALGLVLINISSERVIESQDEMIDHFKVMLRQYNDEAEKNRNSSSN